MQDKELEQDLKRVVEEICSQKARVLEFHCQKPNQLQSLLDHFYTVTETTAKTMFVGRGPYCLICFSYLCGLFSNIPFTCDSWERIINSKLDREGESM